MTRQLLSLILKCVISLCAEVINIESTPPNKKRNNASKCFLNSQNT